MLRLPAQKFVLPLLLLIPAALSVWLFQDQPEEGRSVTPLNQNAPDSFMENFTTQSLDASGRPQYELRAARMAHFDRDQRSEFTRPHFTAYRPDGQQWTVAAETGLALDGTEQVLLNGEVVIERFPAADTTANLQIQTRDLRVTPAEDYAETDQLTTIVQGGGASTATLRTQGLQVHFRQGVLELLSQVRGTYVP